MSGLVIAEVEIVDPEAFEEYRSGVPATVAAFGGKYLVRGMVPETVEGERSAKRLTIIGFESLAKARAWYDSVEYRPFRAIRERTTLSVIRIVEGL